MQILSWVYAAVLILFLAGLLIAISIALCFHAWRIFQSLGDALLDNAIGVLFNVLFNIQFAIVLAASFSEAAYFSHAPWNLFAIISSLWLFVVALLFTVSFAKVNYERAFKDGAKIFVDTSYAKWFAELGPIVKSAVGFWAIFSLFLSMGLLFFDIDQVEGFRATTADKNAGFMEYVVFSLQNAAEAIPFDLVDNLGIHLSRIHLHVSNPVEDKLIAIYIFFFKFAVNALVIAAIMDAYATYKGKGSAERFS